MSSEAAAGRHRRWGCKGIGDRRTRDANIGFFAPRGCVCFNSGFRRLPGCARVPGRRATVAVSQPRSMAGSRSCSGPTSAMGSSSKATTGRRSRSRGRPGRDLQQLRRRPTQSPQTRYPPSSNLAKLHTPDRASPWNCARPPRRRLHAPARGARAVPGRGRGGRRGNPTEQRAIICRLSPSLLVPSSDACGLLARLHPAVNTGPETRCRRPSVATLSRDSHRRLDAPAMPRDHELRAKASAQSRSGAIEDVVRRSGFGAAASWPTHVP